MKKKNKAKKSITAVGAVVAAGLTPGMVTGAPVPESLNTDMNLTAADAVSIDGNLYEFEDLFAMNQGTPYPVDQIVVVYGSPKAMKAMKEKNKKRQKELVIIDSLNNELSKMQNEIDDLREQVRNVARHQDYIQRAIQDSYKLVYGPPRPRFTLDNAESLRSIISIDKTEAINLVQDKVLGYAYKIVDKPVNPKDNIFNDLKLNTQQLEAFKQRIYEELGVTITSDMMKKLGTLERIANFIVEVATPIK